MTDHHKEAQVRFIMAKIQIIDICYKYLQVFLSVVLCVCIKFLAICLSSSLYFLHRKTNNPYSIILTPICPMSKIVFTRWCAKLVCLPHVCCLSSMTCSKQQMRGMQAFKCFLSIFIQIKKVKPFIIFLLLPNYWLQYVDLSDTP